MGLSLSRYAAPMNPLSREQLRALMEQVLTAQGKTLPDGDAADLGEIGFRSLDFSELALRVEDETGDELNFEAAGLRQIVTVGDVLDMLTELQTQ
jgi:acyl carrier protein